MDEDLVSQQLYFLASCQMQWSNPGTEREGEKKKKKLRESGMQKVAEQNPASERSKESYITRTN